MKIELAPRGNVEALLFSEGGARAVYSVSPEKAAAFEDAWSGFPCVKAGEAGGDRFDWQGIFSLPIEELEKAFTEEK